MVQTLNMCEMQVWVMRDTKCLSRGGSAGMQEMPSVAASLPRKLAPGDGVSAS